MEAARMFTATGTHPTSLTHNWLSTARRGLPAWPGKRLSQSRTVLTASGENGKNCELHRNWIWFWDFMGMGMGMHRAISKSNQQERRLQRLHEVIASNNGIGSAGCRIRTALFQGMATAFAISAVRGFIRRTYGLCASVFAAVISRNVIRLDCVLWCPVSVSRLCRNSDKLFARWSPLWLCSTRDVTKCNSH